MPHERRHLVLASELPGRPVVSMRTGDAVAEVRRAVFDRATHQLAGLVVDAAEHDIEFVATRQIHAIGPGAVMLGSDPSPEQAPDEHGAVGGTRLLTTRGDELGTVDDMVLDTGANPRAVAYRIVSPNGERLIPWTAPPEVSSGAVTVRVHPYHTEIEDLRRLAATLDALSSSADPRHVAPPPATVEESTSPGRADVDPVGQHVLDTRGHLLGEVTDVHLDTDGTLSAVVTAEGRVPAARVRAVGRDAVVVDATT